MLDISIMRAAPAGLATSGGLFLLAALSWVGGGFYIYQGSPTISNNVIEKNHTCSPVTQDEEKLGGGIYATGSNVSILDNVIRNNTSGRGAGIAADGPKGRISGQNKICDRRQIRKPPVALR